MLKSSNEEVALLDVIQSTFKSYKEKLIEIKEYTNAINALERLSSSIIGIDSQKWFEHQQF